MAYVQSPRFQEPAMAAPLLFSWGARALYVGAALNLSPHRNAVGVVALGLDDEFGIANDPANPEQGYVHCRSAVIPPNTLHHLVASSGRMAFLYLDARSRDLRAMQTHARISTPRAALHLRNEHELISALLDLADRSAAWAPARRRLEAILSAHAPVSIDPRIRKAVAKLHAEAGARLPLEEVAAHVGLSPSRCLHLFKNNVGVPFRRYQVWLAIGHAMRTIARGANLTGAAHSAGFSSSAHFSTTFRAMFGLEPSRLLNATFTREDA